MTSPTTEEAAALADEICSAANIVSHDGYYELDTDAAALVIDRLLASQERAIAEAVERCAKVAESYETQHELNEPIARNIRRNIAKAIREGTAHD